MYIHHRIKCWTPNLLLNRLTHPLSLSQSTHQLNVLYPPQSLTTTIVTRLYPTPLSNFALTKRINLMLLDEIVLPSRQNPRQPMQLSQDFFWAICILLGNKALLLGNFELQCDNLSKKKQRNWKNYNANFVTLILNIWKLSLNMKSAQNCDL